MSYIHLTPICRGRIQALANEGKSGREIAVIMERSHTCINRELKRNSTVRGYEASKAQELCRERRMSCRPSRKLEHQPLRDFIFEHIPGGMSPEQVSGRLAILYPDDPRMQISHEAIYQGLYADERMHCLIQYLPQARPRRRNRGQGKTRRGPSIPNRVGIEQRPEVVNRRTRFGDWEGDTVVGTHQQGFIATFVERRSTLLRARKTDTKQAGEVAKAAIEALIDMPASWLKTLTFDNGTEFAKHADIAESLPLDIYFATPYSSYQRGTNENTNGLLRRYFPKGTDLRQLTQERLQQVTEEINNRPRKKLGYRTPNEVFAEYLENKRGALRS